MRILLVTDSFAPEGLCLRAATIRAEALALARRGHEVRIFTRTRRPSTPEYEVTARRDGPLRVVGINVTFRNARNLEWLTADRRVHEAFEECLGTARPEVVHVHHLKGLSTTLAHAVKARGLPLVMSLHDSWLLCPRGDRLTARLESCDTLDRERCHGCVSKLWPGLLAERAAERTVKDPVLGTLAPASFAEFDRNAFEVLRLADVLLCPSESQRERMLEFPLEAEQLVVAPGGVDVRNSGRPLPGPRLTRFGYLGRITPAAGIEVLLDAFHRLKGRGYSLEMVGELEVPADDPGFADRFERELSGNEELRYLAPVAGDDPYELFERIEALVVPMIAVAGEALAARAALAAGLPVVGSDLGALREVLDGESDAVLVAPGDAGRLATAMNDLGYAPPPPGSRRRGAAGTISIERHVQVLESCYSRAAARAAARAPRLVVAPPRFPPDTRPGARSDLEIPWHEIRVRTSQRGSVGAVVRTHLPSDATPTLGLVLDLAVGDRPAGAVEIDVDFSAIAEAAAAAAASLVPAPLEAERAAAPPSAGSSPASGPAETGRAAKESASAPAKVPEPTPESASMRSEPPPAERAVRRVRTIPGRDAGRILRALASPKRGGRHHPPH